MNVELHINFAVGGGALKLQVCKSERPSKLTRAIRAQEYTYQWLHARPIL